MIYLFFCHSLLYGTQEPKSQKEMASAFLQEFLFGQGACYTLLGDKPVTSMSIFIGNAEQIYVDGLSEEALRTLTFVDGNMQEYFNAWKAITSNKTFKNFFFFEESSPEDPTSICIYFMNIQSLKTVFHKHYPLFYKHTKIPTWTSFLEELKRPNQLLWKQLFQDHKLAGILYGFSEDNARTFIKPSISRSFSDIPVACATQEHFSLPIYVVSEKDKTVEKYKKQREKIKKIYNNQDVLDITFKILQNQH